ncbi:transcriptional regulator [Clostridia bacterium]|nr:transcriptional regulator [Clostridia bacterium]
MLHTGNFEEIYTIAEALSSKVRLDIVKFLLTKNTNINELAKEIHLTNSALTMHIKKLEDAGIIAITHESGTRGMQKVCSIKNRKVLLEMDGTVGAAVNSHAFEIRIGHYSNYEVVPTCGLVTAQKIIGILDDPRYFAFPERFDAELIWLTDGFLEYKIPNSLRASENPVELQISMEIASEAPGYSEHFPSDIHFAINGVALGYWTSPGEFNDRRGLFTPKWWFPNLGQYGQLKLLSVNAKGTFIDGLKISDVTIGDLNIDYRSDISFVLGAPRNAVNRGGLTLFGKNFGDYAQGIVFSVLFENKENGKPPQANA